jgi:hypothetical protein
MHAWCVGGFLVSLERCRKVTVRVLDPKIRLGAKGRPKAGGEGPPGWGWFSSASAKALAHNTCFLLSGAQLGIQHRLRCIATFRMHPLHSLCVFYDVLSWRISVIKLCTSLLALNIALSFPRRRLCCPASSGMSQELLVKRPPMTLI